MRRPRECASLATSFRERRMLRKQAPIYIPDSDTETVPLFRSLNCDNGSNPPSRLESDEGFPHIVTSLALVFCRLLNATVASSCSANRRFRVRFTVVDSVFRSRETKSYANVPRRATRRG